jgi:hypothetical protein
MVETMPPAHTYHRYEIKIWIYMQDKSEAHLNEAEGMFIEIRANIIY